MSINDLQRTIDTLVEAVAKKNKDFDALKRDYDNKLRIINDYIYNLKSVIDDERDETGEIDSEDFVKSIEKASECPSCRHSLTGIVDEQQFVLIPKRKLKYMLGENDLESNKNDNKNTSREADVERVSKNLAKQSLGSEESVSSSSSKSFHSKTKRICSYCKKSGHSRAKCLERLNKPLNT